MNDYGAADPVIVEAEEEIAVAAVANVPRLRRRRPNVGGGEERSGSACIHAPGAALVSVGRGTPGAARRACAESASV